MPKARSTLRPSSRPPMIPFAASETLQGALDTQFARTAAVQAELGALKATLK